MTTFMLSIPQKRYTELIELFGKTHVTIHDEGSIMPDNLLRRGLFYVIRYLSNTSSPIDKPFNHNGYIFTDMKTLAKDLGYNEYNYNLMTDIIRALDYISTVSSPSNILWLYIKTSHKYNGWIIDKVDVRKKVDGVYETLEICV